MWLPELKLLISDLGFVSGSKAENLGAETMQVSVREPGVLAPGSYMFRAPEQMEQGYEINCQVEPDTHSDTGPASSTKIAFDNIGDKNIEPGDWFETDAVAATDRTPPPFKSYIDSVDHEKGRVLVTLKDRFDYSGAYPVFHGHITRLSALHSDLFSVGCILYFLISLCRRPAHRQRRDRRPHPPWPTGASSVETFDVIGRLGPDWDGLIVAAARVTRLTWHKDTNTGLWRQTSKTALYASQISLSATAIAAAIRQHWGIENRSHHVRDVTFFEDQSRIRTKPGHFARLRSFALNILRANGTTNVNRELYLNALNPHQAISYRMT